MASMLCTPNGGGLNFQQTVFITQIHSPSLWHAVYNADLSTDPMQALTYFMERKSVELADVVISPSAYMLDWVKRHDFNPPALSFVQPNLLEAPTTPLDSVSEPRPVAQIEELVFFGRLEYRKGLVQFCNALDRLPDMKTKPAQVTFLGKFSRVGQEHSGLYIARRAKKWNFPVKIIARLGQVEALDYLRTPGRLAVMPSVADNSPYTVYECLAVGIPFLARDVGGVAELIDQEDHVACLFDDNPNKLARMLAKALTEGVRRPKLAINIEANRETWRFGLPALAQQFNQAALKKNRGKRMKTPWVSVCLTHYNRPKLLRQAIGSLLEQDYPNLEVILVDDGSPGKAAAKLLQSLEEEFSRRNWKILRLENGYLGKARNIAARSARGEYLLFMDDDNVAKPNMASRFVQAALSSGAHLVTAVFNVFSGLKAPNAKTPTVDRFLPAGDIVSFSVVTNAIGDANSLIRRELFEELGGFSEDYGLGHEDFELYLRAVLSGVRLNVVPEPLFWYRRNGESMLSTTHMSANRVRSLRPFFDRLSAPMTELAVLAHGLAVERTPETALTTPELERMPPEDRRRLVGGDPDAPETVEALVNVLKQSKNDTMAEMIQQNLEHSALVGSTGISSTGTIITSIVLAARQDDMKALRKLFASLGKTSSAKNTIASACFTALAELNGKSGNSGTIELLIQRLIRIRPKSLEARLIAAKSLLSRESIAAGLKNFDVALSLADMEYLRLRPDVAAAVKRKQYSCGLLHYDRHGKNEGSSWPGYLSFKAIWPQLTRVIQTGISLDLGIKTRTRLLIALRVFQPLRTRSLSN